MATKTTTKMSTEDEHEYMFADWVYQVPGFVLMAGGFGALAFITVA